MDRAALETEAVLEIFTDFQKTEAQESSFRETVESGRISNPEISSGGERNNVTGDPAEVSTAFENSRGELTKAKSGYGVDIKSAPPRQEERSSASW
jgi:hypothetical protein